MAKPERWVSIGRGQTPPLPMRWGLQRWVQRHAGAPGARGEPAVRGLSVHAAGRAVFVRVWVNRAATYRALYPTTCECGHRMSHHRDGRCLYCDCTGGRPELHDVDDEHDGGHDDGQVTGQRNDSDAAHAHAVPHRGGGVPPATGGVGGGGVPPFKRKPINKSNAHDAPRFFAAHPPTRRP